MPSEILKTVMGALRTREASWRIAREDPFLRLRALDKVPAVLLVFPWRTKWKTGCMLAICRTP